jgi:hypothetical protein
MAEDEPEQVYDDAQPQRAALPRYSTHKMDRKLASEAEVYDVNVPLKQDIYRPISRTARPPPPAALMFDGPSFATDLLETSTPIRPATAMKRDITDPGQTTTESGIPLAYAGQVYNSSSVKGGIDKAIGFDDASLQEMYDNDVEEESFNNTISSVPSPAPRIAAAAPQAKHETDRVATIYRHHRDPSDTVEDTTINLEMEALEREAEDMERRALAGAASGGRGKLELRLMRKKAESFWEFGLTLRMFRKWLQEFEYERVSSVSMQEEGGWSWFLVY